MTQLLATASKKTAVLHTAWAILVVTSLAGCQQVESTDPATAPNSLATCPCQDLNEQASGEGVDREQPVESIDPAIPADLQIVCQDLGEQASGEGVDRELAPGDSACYRLPFASGDFLRLTIDQFEADVVLHLLDPGGRLVVDADRVIGDSGPEPLLAVAKETGDYEIWIKAAERSGEPGRILVRVDPLRPASSAEELAAKLFNKLRKAKHSASSKFESLQAKSSTAREKTIEGIISGYQEVMEASKAAGETVLWAEAAVRLGFARRKLEGRAKAREDFERVATEASADAWIWQVMALDTLAYIDIQERKPATAIEAINKALALEAGRDLRFRRARLYQLLGQARQQQGAIQLALDAYRKAAALLRPWRAHNRGRVLHNLGTLYRQNLGRPREALELFKEAAALLQTAGAAKTYATTINQMGETLETLDQPDEAARCYRQALSMRRELGDSCGEASTLVRIALLDQASGDSDEAERKAERVRAILGAETCPGQQIAIRLRLAALAEERGQREWAKNEYRQSRDRAVLIGDRDAEMAALVGLARVCHGHTCGENPLELTDRALEIAEDTRAGLAQENHRLTFGSRTQALFDLRIDLQWPTNYEAALRTAERARARALRDRLRQIDAKVGRGVSAEALENARHARSNLNLKTAERRARELKGGLSDDDRERLEREVDQLVARLDAADAEIARQAPAFFELMRAEPIELAALQSLLDPSTVMLVYRLGERRSYLWWITQDAFDSAELKARKGIEELVEGKKGAEGARDLLLARDPQQVPIDWYQDSFEPLAKEILPADIAPFLAGRRRLIIVPDGVLETIPFAVLPDPTVDYEKPLIDDRDRQISYLPSASVWQELSARSKLAPTKGWLAMIADPAYGSDLPRLGGSRREAEEIEQLLPADFGRTMRLGHEATKATVLSGKLKGYRYVHLAVHGEVHPRQPALSFLAFATRDASGRAIDGRLHAHELYGLDLPAELVVLAACDTGLGPRIPGEGLVSGLSRGFFYAGARRVMASLWPIPDADTPELMSLFYRGLFRDHDPAAALYEAQRSLYSDGRHPYTWAGFVLQGP